MTLCADLQLDSSKALRYVFPARPVAKLAWIGYYWSAENLIVNRTCCRRYHALFWWIKTVVVYWLNSRLDRHMSTQIGCWTLAKAQLDSEFCFVQILVDDRLEKFDELPWMSTEDLNVHLSTRNCRHTHRIRLFPGMVQLTIRFPSTNGSKAVVSHLLHRWQYCPCCASLWRKLFAAIMNKGKMLLSFVHHWNNVADRCMPFSQRQTAIRAFGVIMTWLVEPVKNVLAFVVNWPIFFDGVSTISSDHAWMMLRGQRRKSTILCH